MESPVVARLPVKPELVPTVAGGIQIEWHTDELDLVIECDPTGVTSYYFDDIERSEDHEGSLTDGTDALGRAFVALWSRASAPA